MAFDDPNLSAMNQGRLQDLHSKFLYIDAPAELRPPRGTFVMVNKLQTDGAEFSFSSEMRGR